MTFDVRYSTLLRSMPIRRSIRGGIATLCLLLAGLPLLAQENVGGQYRITTTPPGAEATLDGKSVGQTPLALSGIPPGEHLLVVALNGHHIARRTLNVIPNARNVVDITMKPITGWVIIDSSPNGAEVFVRGASRGMTPILLTDLLLGDHRVRLSKTGFVAKEIELSITDRVPIRKMVDMTSNAATLVLDSQPQAANVLLNGADRGVTPVTLDRIPAGKVVLEMAVDGYEGYRQELVLDAGQIEEIRAVLSPLPGSLEIVTIPDNVRIYIDDKFRGTSPLKLEKVEPKLYRIRAEKEGFDDLTTSVMVTRADELVEELRLEQTSGLLSITTEPDGVTVIIDGVIKGITQSQSNDTDRVSLPLRVQYIPEGEHALELTKKGYFSHKSDITIERLETLTQHEALKRRFIPNYEVITRKGTTVIGVFHEVDVDGSIRIEISQGVIKTIKKSDIRLQRALRGENIPTPEETRVTTPDP